MPVFALRSLRPFASSAILAAAFACVACSSDSSPAQTESGPPSWSVGEVVRWKGAGVLAKVQAPYGTVQIVRLAGSHYDMGFQYGYLLHDDILQLWKKVFVPYVATQAGMGEGVVEIVFNSLLDEAWKHMLPFTPQAYLDELRGVEEGAAAAGVEKPADIANAVRHVMLLAELSQSAQMDGSIETLQDYVVQGHSKAFADYFGLTASRNADIRQQVCQAPISSDPEVEFLNRLGNVPLLTRTCSYFSVWGDRTDGRQLATRLLDWDKDIGLQDFRLITVFEPTGGTPHMSIGYVGFLGALAGMSANGVAIGHVGASSVHERLDAEPGTLKSREILEHAKSLDDGFRYFANSVEDGKSRPGTIGANAMVVFGDPAGHGAGAEGIAAETTGIFSSAFRYGPSPKCGEEAFLVEIGVDGTQAHQWSHTSDPQIVNLEGDAFEVDVDAKVRTFQVDGNGDFVRDANGELTDDPAGKPYRVGQRIPCALFRGDEGMAYGVRKYQLAANGPQGTSERKLMHRSGTYQGRYAPQHDMITAYYEGKSFTWEGATVIPDNGGVRVPIGPEEAKRIAKVVAMSGNVFSVIYDTTNLVVHVAYESGTGDTWKKASDNEYLELQMKDLL